jgi:hypothetical protein
MMQKQKSSVIFVSATKLPLQHGSTTQTGKQNDKQAITVRVG